jgi:hypothetical protein
MADKPKIPEEIRAERIANLKDPEARSAIDKIEKERQEKLTELRAYQRESFDKWTDQVARQREQYLNSPHPAPPGMKEKPVLTNDDKLRVRDDAKAEVYRQIKVQDQAKNLAYDRKVDQVLDAAERKQAREQGQILHKGSSPDLEH